MDNRNLEVAEVNARLTSKADNSIDEIKNKEGDVEKHDSVEENDGTMVGKRADNRDAGEAEQQESMLEEYMITNTGELRPRMANQKPEHNTRPMLNGSTLNRPSNIPS